MRHLIFLFLLLFIQSAYGQKYLFEENKGQWHDDVLFRTEIPGGYLFITKTGMKYLYIHPGDMKKFHGHNEKNAIPARKSMEKQGIRMQAIAVDFHNIAPSLKTEKKLQQPTYSNYFTGNDPSKWASEVRKYEEVTIKNIYPGIHLKFYHNDEKLKYDLVVEARADPSQIRMEYKGANALKLVDGKLEVYSDFGKSLELAPVSFQVKKQFQKTVPCHYKLESNVLSFQFPEGFNRKIPLIIDPALIFSTYSGSIADNWGFTATFDEQGNLYSGGIVRAPGYPVATGAFQSFYGGNTDVGILKFDSLGEKLLFATYIGGSEAEVPHSLIVDSRGDLIIFGTTSSANFPTSGSAWQKTFLGGSPLNADPFIPIGGIPYNNGSDLYLFKLSGNGKTMRASTFLGGTENDGIMLTNDALTKNYGDQFRGEVNLDREDNIYIASYTASDDFPVVNGFQNTFGMGTYDGLVVKMNPALDQLMWSTYVGGSGMDGLYNIKVDKENNVYVGGGTTSLDYPVTAGAYKETKSSAADIDGVVTRISHDGSQVLSSTLLGTSSYDQVYFIDLDSSQSVYALGQTQGEYPVSEGVYSNDNAGQFIHKLSNELDTTLFSTVFGSGSGSPDIRPTAFLVNECGNLLISGWGGETNSSSVSYVGGNTFGLPVTANAFQSTTDGTDFYLIVLLRDAKQLLYATYIGGNIANDHVDGGTSRFDKRGIVYQSVCAGCWGYSDFPTTPNAWSRKNGSSLCNNAVFKFDVAQLVAGFTTDSERFDSPGLVEGCAPLKIMFLNKSIGGESFHWDFGNGEESTKKDSILIEYETPGTYDVVLGATDINTCTREDFAYGTITVFDQHFDIMDPQKICYGSQITLNADGGVAYEWRPAGYLNDPNLKNPVAQPDTTTYFKVRITNEHGCSEEDSVLITVVPDFSVGFSFSKENSCFDTPTIAFSNHSTGAESFTWNLGNGSFVEKDSLVYQYQQSDTFSIQLKGRLDVCEKTSEQMVPSVKTFIPNVITPNHDGKNDFFRIITAEPVDISIHNRWGDKVFEKENYNAEFNGKDIVGGVYYYELKFREDGTSCYGWLQVLK